MLKSIFHAGSFSAAEVCLAMAVALVSGLIIAAIYMLLGSHNKNFVVMLSVMPLLVQVVIMIVNGNLGASVAVLGAFGLVRFRSAPGTAREIGFIFFAMAAGLAAGMGFLTLCLLVTVIIGGVLLLLAKSSFGNVSPKNRELRITIPENLNYPGVFDDLFQIYTRNNRLIRVRTTKMGTLFELVYRISLRDPAQEKEFLDALRCRNGNLSIILTLEQGDKADLL